MNLRRAGSPTTMARRTGSTRITTLVKSHRVLLTGLTPETLYYFTVSTKDGAGNGPTLSAVGTFQTTSTPDTYPPVILEGPIIVNITHQSVVIRWVTDEPANSVIEYGLAADQLTELESRAALVQHHNMPITGLEAGTKYYFRVLSQDSSGNGPTVSRIFSFTTDDAPNGKKPEITKDPEVLYVCDDKATLSWETDEPTDTVVEYGEDGDTPRQEGTAEKVTKHQVTLVNLKQGSSYKVAVAATDQDGNTTYASLDSPRVLLAFTGEGGSFIPALSADTSTIPDTTAPVIVSGPTLVRSTNSSLVVEWETNEIADSIVQYGVSGSSSTRQSGDIRDVAAASRRADESAALDSLRCERSVHGSERQWPHILRGGKLCARPRRRTRRRLCSRRSPQTVLLSADCGDDHLGDRRIGIDAGRVRHRLG